MFQRTEVCSWSSAVTRRRTRRSCRPCVRTWSECCVRRTSRNRRTRPCFGVDYSLKSGISNPTMTDCGKDYKEKGDFEFYNAWELIQHYEH